MRVDSLAFRLFAMAGLWTLIVLPLTGLLIYSLIRSHVLDGFESQLQTYVWVLQAESTDSDNTLKRPNNMGEPLFGIVNSGWYWQVRALNQPDANQPSEMLISGSLTIANLPSPARTGKKPDSNGFYWQDFTGPLGQPLRIAERTGRLGKTGAGPLYSFVVAGPLDWPQSRIASFGLTTAIALAFAGLGLLLATYWQVRFGLAPLSRVEQGLAKIRSGEADHLEGQLPSEIAALQSELNALIESNQEIIERARTQVGNLAHALKTPLAVITNEAELRDTAFAMKVSEQAELMRSQVSHYLDRARVAARVGTIGRSIEIRSVALALQRTLGRIYRDKGLTLTVNCPPEARFAGEQQDLEELLGNLLDNACKWAKTTVQITVRLRSPADTGGSGRAVEIIVEDDGPGLTSEKRDRIVERGVKLDETVPGSGLGLSIVGDLVRIYRGTWSLEASDRGGLKARLILPAIAG